MRQEHRTAKGAQAAVEGPCLGQGLKIGGIPLTLVLDGSGVVVSVNDPQGGGPLSTTLLGRDYFRFLAKFPCLPAWVDRELSDRIRSLLEGRETRFCHEHVCTRGSAGRLLRVTGTRLEGPDGPSILLVHEDVSLERSEEQVLRLARFTLDHAADAIFWVSESGGFTYVNAEACRLLGYTRDELLGMKVWEIDDALTGENWPAAWQRAREGDILRLATTCRAHDGRRIPVEITVNRQVAEGREFHCTFVRDVTSRKLLEDQFRQAQKLEAVGRLAGGVAHDFNNLLTVINGYSDLLVERAAPNGSDRPLLQEISDAGRRAAGLTRQLLAFSRKRMIQPVVLDLNALLGQMSTMLRRLLGEDIRIDLRTEHGLGLIKADPGQIEQVVMNLSVNARDAMRTGGTLTLETRNLEGGAGPAQVRLTVSDTGCGMNEEVRSHLFEPFFTTKEPGKGTGLGLSTVYGIVAQAGGRISCESEVGRGTEFTLLFPRCEGNCAVVSAQAPGLGRTAGGTETVLLAEDEDAVRTLARVVLEQQGYRVIPASNGREALERAKDHAGPIDLLLTDMVMPGMNGLELIREFGRTNPGARILLMSGYSEAGMPLDDARRMTVHHLEKPFLPRVLASRVRETLDRRSPPPPLVMA